MNDFRKDEKEDLRLLLEYKAELRKVGLIIRVVCAIFIVFDWLSENLDKVRKWLTWLLVPFACYEWQSVVRIVELMQQ